ncbi:UbiA family prenyltransferase [Tuwongella immobilis]|uniref:Prenyltransferase n=1 Tax=Tuwongella immobilis TaxID=692036 RepID=A0A6C2YQW4_9BACT|nr:UbiA family prenyltransferase [Tuwongella immobilis]VIP04038.1 prenyltransferase : Uncharacterized protein OS=Blastopirellula marina DSM 3645 GN=DSM3645_20452 PE=4 SV=1: UbiA [Tuwongella immobilis]VTS05443.1 prenyltransferase : Uncharacterized protein OS=Blastopirellula marina DSM 3645 GN=DSM3645_20452 PE=4 SV=1: UbiA [Tuwongella immobilis]
MAWLPFARLMRIPNVWTAFADIALGAAMIAALVPTSGIDHFPWRMLGLMFASGLLYCSGMVWNDIFDLAEDRRDRPFRPLPSGQVRKAVAVRLAMTLMLAGVGLAAIVGIGAIPETGGFQPMPLMLAGALVVAILLYDRWMKHTPIGPISMGSCRFLNVLFGLSLVLPEQIPWSVRLHVASVIGVYIVGVTWFARTEATQSNRMELLGAVGVMVAAMVLALTIPLQLGPGQSSRWFPYFLATFIILIGGPIRTALQTLQPKPVQQAVKRCILGLVMLDAVLAGLFIGVPGLLILFLLPPALVMGKWVYST